MTIQVQQAASIEGIQKQTRLEKQLRTSIDNLREANRLSRVHASHINRMLSGTGIPDASGILDALRKIDQELDDFLQQALETLKADGK